MPDLPVTGWASLVGSPQSVSHELGDLNPMTELTSRGNKLGPPWLAGLARHRERMLPIGISG